MSIHIKPSHKGKLHAALGVAQGKPLSTSMLEKKKKGAGPHMRKMIAFALAARKWKH